MFSAIEIIIAWMTHCSVCNSYIKAPRPNKKYCSPACKQRAYYGRKNQLNSPGQEGNRLFPYEDYLNHLKELEENDVFVNYLEYCYFRSLLPENEKKSHNIVPFIIELNESFRVSNQNRARDLEEKMHHAIVQMLFKR